MTIISRTQTHLKVIGLLRRIIEGSAGKKRTNRFPVIGTAGIWSPVGLRWTKVVFYRTREKAWRRNLGHLTPIKQSRTRVLKHFPEGE